MYDIEGLYPIEERPLKPYEGPKIDMTEGAVVNFTHPSRFGEELNGTVRNGVIEVPHYRRDEDGKLSDELHGHYLYYVNHRGHLSASRSFRVAPHIVHAKKLARERRKRNDLITMGIASVAVISLLLAQDPRARFEVKAAIHSVLEWGQELNEGE